MNQMLPTQVILALALIHEHRSVAIPAQSQSEIGPLFTTHNPKRGYVKTSRDS